MLCQDLVQFPGPILWYMYMVYMYMSKQFSWLKVTLNLSFYCKPSLGKTKNEIIKQKN